MWFGDVGVESAKFWMVVLTELRNRGVHRIGVPPAAACSGLGVAGKGRAVCFGS